MAREHLATYLNDHLAGAQVATDLLGHLERLYADTPFEEFCRDLNRDIREDGAELDRLLGRLGIGVSQMRKAAGWLSDKAAQLKLRLDDPVGGPLYLFEALEVLAVGIHGKHALWDALAAAAEQTLELRGVDYDRLVRRAQEQRQRVEVKRLQAAKAALGDQSGVHERPMAGAAKS